MDSVNGSTKNVPVAKEGKKKSMINEMIVDLSFPFLL